MNKLKKQSGITMIEIMAVMVIISLLTIAVYRGVQTPLENSRASKVETDFRVLKKTIDSYIIENNGFPDVSILINDPSNTTVLDAFLKKMNSYSEFKLVKHTTSGTMYFTLKTEVIKDPWNTPYYILFPKTAGQPIYIISHGPDKQRGTYSTGSFGDDLILIIEKK